MARPFMESKHYTQHKPQTLRNMVVEKASRVVKRPAADFYGYWHVKPVATLLPQSVYFYSPRKEKHGIQ